MHTVSKARAALAVGAILTACAVAGFGANPVLAQQPAQSGTTTQAKLSKEKLEQIVAPVALYPDALLAQVLMASTYPLEIVQASRWASANASLKGKALEDALQGKPWDPSVKSIVAVPSVLTMMNDKLEWTQQLGDAFLAQKNDVMSAVQSLRLRADQAGTLKTTKEQKVSKSTTGSTTYVVIEPQNPTVVYVPVYNPTVVYGAWPYATYPPYSYYPPGYVASNVFWFGTGVAVGAALWGNCNWGRNDININVNNYNKFNRTNISNTTWRHDATHRQGVPYSNSDVAREFRQNHRDHADREQFRGRETDRGGANLQTDRPKARDLDKVADRAPSDIKRDVSNARRDHQGSAFDGAGSGRDVRADGARGQTSRVASQQRPAARAPAASATRAPAGGAARAPGGGAARGNRPGGRGR